MGLRRWEKEMSLGETIDLLKRSPVGRLAMAVGDRPYVVPMHFLYDGGKIYFHCASEGKKMEYIARNPNVCFEVDEFLGLRPGEGPCDWGTRYRSAIVYGRASALSEESERIEVLNKFLEKYAGRGHRIQKPPRDVTVMGITIEEITGKQDLR
jgi:nitroimidazol reductase NimA-like FMN-containing flavoprotein (pyridoxamine 5'-phosphate oxidase superfamily)